MPFRDVCGQDRAVRLLRSAWAGGRLAQAYCFTGPPGVGKRTTAVALAQAVKCLSPVAASAAGEDPDACGTCRACTLIAAGRHPDVTLTAPEEKTVITIDQIRGVAARAGLGAYEGAGKVWILDPAHEMQEPAANAFLKTLEEPPTGSLFILVTTGFSALLPTIRSRCRHLQLATPSTAEVAEALTRSFGVDPAMASFAARAAQGHIGRARALATSEEARLRRQDVLRIPTQLHDLGSCLALAADLVATVNDDSNAICDPLDEREMAQLRAAYGEGAEGRGIGTVERRAKGAVKALEDRQKKRRRRVVRDQLDRAIVDLIAFYRDVLVVQLGAASPLVNDEMRPQIERLAAESSPEDTLRRVDALERTRNLLEANVAPLLAFESLTVSLRDPSLV